jgi:hypothetical protein
MMNTKEIAEEILDNFPSPDMEEVVRAYLDLLKKMEGKVLVPVEPTPEMLHIIFRSEWPEDWEAGKEAQIRLGIEVVYPKTEIEIAYGQYKRLIKAANG